ncbi:MAG: hypothetical protein H8D26_04385 [Methanomicrobia archaeon]|nr:hypothetical protein [Methanomicrobia archaeon]
MAIDSATVVELVNLVTGILILAVAIYAQRKFRFVIFKLGWDIIAASGAIRVVGSLFRAYYTYIDSYELIPWGRVFLVIGRIVLVIGIYVLAIAGIKLWGEEGESERNRT